VVLFFHFEPETLSSRKCSDRRLEQVRPHTLSLKRWAHVEASDESHLATVEESHRDQSDDAAIILFSHAETHTRVLGLRSKPFGIMPGRRLIYSMTSMGRNDP
jgi:hypothetical protein